MAHRVPSVRQGIGRFTRTLTAALALFASTSVAFAETKIPAVIGDHMVLQRGQKNPLWGWDDPSSKVTVTIGSTAITATANAEGKWSVELPAMEAGGPHSIEIKGSSRREIKDVLVGEVWLCSGQSNMEWTRQATPIDPAKEERAAANYPQHSPHQDSRTSPRRLAPERRPLRRAGRSPAPSKLSADFTAVGYFFGRQSASGTRRPDRTHRLQLGRHAD